jgi:RNA polymerase sigma-70 factor (ECF subfamily)
MAIKPIPNESELIKQVISGSERAFSKLFDGYYKSLGDYVYRLTESLEITEEIDQDVFIKIWTKKENLKEIESFSNYLFIISRNQTYNFLRKKANERVRQLEWEKDFEEQSMLNDDKSGEFYRSLLEKAIEKLPPQQKKVYLLSRNDRLKYVEIAQKLNISSETVKKHMQSAIKFLKSNINVENDGVVVVILLAQLIIK